MAGAQQLIVRAVQGRSGPWRQQVPQRLQFPASLTAARPGCRLGGSVPGRECRLAQISIVAHCSEIPHLRQRTRRLADDRTTDSRFPADPNHI